MSVLNVWLHHALMPSSISSAAVGGSQTGMNTEYLGPLSTRRSHENASCSVSTPSLNADAGEMDRGRKGRNRSNISNLG